MSEINFSDPTYFTNNHALSMTLRDYFAAAAMQAMVATIGTKDEHVVKLAESAYLKADAMLKAREK